MHRLNPHIKELLLLYDCVILPGLGGFVSADVPARFDAKTNRFIAPGKEISFNKNLRHNDGLICQSVMKSENIDFKAAQDKVDAWIKDIHLHLTKANYNIKGVGELFLNEAGNLAFRPYQMDLVSRNSFGLTSFFFPELKEEEQRVELSQTAKQQVNNGSVSRWLAAASIFIMLLLFSRPTAYNDIQNASVGVSLDTIIENVPQQTAAQKMKPDTEATKVSVVENTHIDTSPEMMAPNVKLVSKPIREKEYHIIIASLADRSKADLYTLNYCLGTFEDYQILENGQRHRVSVKVFDSKEAALPYLEKVRTSHPFFKDAWILTLNK